MEKIKFIIKWALGIAFLVLLGFAGALVGFNNLHESWIFVALAVISCIALMTAGANVLYGILVLKFWSFDSESMEMKRLH